MVGVLRLRSSILGPSVVREAALFLVRGPAERIGESGDGGSPPVDLSGFLSGSVCLPLALPLAPDLVDIDMFCHFLLFSAGKPGPVPEEAEGKLFSAQSVVNDVDGDCCLFRLQVS